MKKLNLILTIALGLFLSVNTKAQTKTDYFPGKWKVTIKGTPQGDAVMNFIFERKDGILLGSVRDSTNKELSTITEIDEKDKKITAAFTIQSYDVTLLLDPVDDDHVKGNLMGMFDATGVRVKETAPKTEAN